MIWVEVTRMPRANTHAQGMRATGRAMRPLIAVLIGLGLVIGLLSLGGAPLWLRVQGASGAQGILEVHYIDVDQGDATLVMGPGVTILIDAGRHDRNDVVPYLRSVGVKSIDLLVGTHPHSDHIGQFPQVLEAFPVKEVWLSGDVHTSRTFERAIDAILNSGAGYHEPRAGERVKLGDIEIEVVHPERVTGDFNNGSIGLRLAYGDVAFLFTGDAEAESEAEMIARGHNLKANVLHVGHHGSSTSSSEAFLRKVQPEIAVYSAGVGNSYGHPHREIVERYRQLGIPLYGTDAYGTIRVKTDGRTFEVSSQRGGIAFAVGAPGPVSGCGPGQVDINTAPKEALITIVHIGESRANELISLRPFSSLEDLTRIRGISEGRLREIEAQGIACVSN